MTAFFEINNLTRAFGGIVAVNDISFSVQQGSIFSIIGPNGAGKTTLFNCISGLYRADSGSILFKGRELMGLRPHQIASTGVARTFQNIELFPHLSTMENLMLGRHLHMKTGLLRGMLMWGPRSFAGREEVAQRRAVEGIIDQLGLEAVREKLVGGLAYGIQKRVELGRALACEPSLLLLDEPAAGMNSEERGEMLFWLKDIARLMGVTIIMIEHHMKMVMAVSDRVLAIDFGRKIAEGSAAEVAAHPDVIRAYLGG